MNPIDEVVSKLEELLAMKSGYGNYNLSDLEGWLHNLPQLLDKAYEARNEMEVMK